MSRNRSSSLLPATTIPGVPLSDHLHDPSVMQGPLLIARSISADTDAPTSPPLNRIESSAELGPIRKRSMSDPTLVVRVSTNPPNGATLSGSQDEGACSSDGSSVEDSWDAVRSKDAVRRYHALKELLTTEYGYLEDLRFLVTVCYFLCFHNVCSAFLSQGLSSQSPYSRCEVLVFCLDFCVVHYRPFLFMDAFLNISCILDYRTIHRAAERAESPEHVSIFQGPEFAVSFHRSRGRASDAKWRGNPTIARTFCRRALPGSRTPWLLERKRRI